MDEFDLALLVKLTGVVIKKATLVVEPSCEHTVST